MLRRYKRQQLKRYEAIRKLFEAQNQRFKDSLNSQLQNPTFTLLKNELPLL